MIKSKVLNIELSLIDANRFRIKTFDAQGNTFELDLHPQAREKTPMRRETQFLHSSFLLGAGWVHFGHRGRGGLS